eukprot:gene19326-21975_t
MFLNSLDSTYLTGLCAYFPEYQGILNNLITVKETVPNRAIVQATHLELGLSVVKFLLEHEGYALSSEACATAVATKDMPLLLYLHEQNCPWDDRTILSAIYRRNLDALYYACANGCPLPDHAMEAAAVLGGVAVMNALHSFGIPYPDTVYLNLDNLTSIEHLRSATFGVISLALFSILMVAGLAVMFAKGTDRTINDYANYGNTFSWFLQFALLVYGPRSLSGNFTLQAKLHCLIFCIWFVVNAVVIATGPIVALFRQGFENVHRFVWPSVAYGNIV